MDHIVVNFNSSVINKKIHLYFLMYDSTKSTGYIENIACFWYIIELLNNKLHGLSHLWWFSVSPWGMCITFVWPRSSLKLTAPSSWSERHLYFASIRLCLDLLFIISITCYKSAFNCVSGFSLHYLRQICQSESCQKSK